MHTLYDSDSYCVLHMLANADSTSMPLLGMATTNGKEASPLVMARHGFEIVDKRTGKEVYLDGSWAELFQQRILDWQINTPTQEEVEDTLEQYVGLAHTPVVVH
ncbi:MAG: DUF3567 domain-containing protein [Rhodoferax sp.]